MSIIPPEKQCSKCGNKYPATAEYFNRDKSRVSGLFPWCKPCSKQDDKKRSPQRLAAAVVRDKANPEKKKARAKKDRLIRREKIKAQQRKWESENRETVRLHSRVQASKRRAHKRRSKGSYTAQDIKQLIKSQKGLCWWCGKALNDKYEIDHRIALSRGGSNLPDNLCLTCPFCNQSKGGKLPWEWSSRLL